MSWQLADDPDCPTPPSGVELVLLPRADDVGGFEVRRALPARERIERAKADWKAGRFGEVSGDETA